MGRPWDSMNNMGTSCLGNKDLRNVLVISGDMNHANLVTEIAMKHGNSANTKHGGIMGIERDFTMFGFHQPRMATIKNGDTWEGDQRTFELSSGFHGESGQLWLSTFP